MGNDNQCEYLLVHTHAHAHAHTYTHTHSAWKGSKREGSQESRERVIARERDSKTAFIKPSSSSGLTEPNYTSVAI